MVKALDLSSNVRMHTWVRTPFLVEWDPGDASFFRYLEILSSIKQHSVSFSYRHLSSVQDLDREIET